MADDRAVAGTGVREKVASILLIGALSMFCAEVLSGSSVLWFLTPWAWLVPFWLYLAHMVLFVNLALRFGRLSMPSLYLWGVLFGLYESWITKVVWAGYPGAAPAWGTVLGFSMPETLIIVFLWHPIFSWILPLMAFEVLGGRDGALPLHRPHLARTGRTLWLGVAAAVVGALLLAMNAHGDAVAVLVTIAGSVALIALFLGVAQAGGRTVSVESLRLGRRGMTVLAAYLALLYGLGFLFIVPERIAPPLTIVLTVGLYAVALLALRAAGPDAPAVERPEALPTAGPDAPLVTRRDLVRGVVLLTALGLLAAVALPIASPLVVVTYLALVVAGPALFGWAVLRIMRARRARPGGAAGRA